MCCCRAVCVWKRFPHSKQNMAISDPENRQREMLACMYNTIYSMLKCPDKLNTATLAQLIEYFIFFWSILENDHYFCKLVWQCMLCRNSGSSESHSLQKLDNQAERDNDSFRKYTQSQWINRRIFIQYQRVRCTYNTVPQEVSGQINWKDKKTRAVRCLELILPI